MIRNLAIVVAVGIGLLHTRAATAFPIIVPDFSGKVLLIVNEEDDNLVAVPIRNDGSADSGHGIALANFNNTGALDTVKSTFSGDPDAVAVTPDGRFAYVHQEDNVAFASAAANTFVRFDLQNVEFHGAGHIKSFDMTGHTWLHDPLAVLNGFLYSSAMDPACDPCTTACGVSLYKMAINPVTGDLGSPTVVTAIDDGSGHVATGINSRMTTDGTCIYVTDNGSNEFCFEGSTIGPQFSPGSKRVYQICDTTVKVWADPTTGGDAPGFSATDAGAGHTIVFGPNNQNLFLMEDNIVYSTTGLVGTTPGSFTQVGTLEGTLPQNEGSAFTTLASGAFLYAGNEAEEEAYVAAVTGAGSGVAAVNAFDIDGEDGAESGLAGDQVEFDEAEGLAIINRSPRDTTGAALFVALPRPTPTLSSMGLVACALILLASGGVLLSRSRSN